MSVMERLGDVTLSYEGGKWYARRPFKFRGKTLDVSAFTAPEAICLLAHMHPGENGELPEASY